jgi:hypothetical protein
VTLAPLVLGERHLGREVQQQEGSGMVMCHLVGQLEMVAVVIAQAVTAAVAWVTVLVVVVMRGLLGGGLVMLLRHQVKGQLEVLCWVLLRVQLPLLLQMSCSKREFQHLQGGCLDHCKGNKVWSTLNSSMRRK